jgi:hypothetical protein
MCINELRMLCEQKVVPLLSTHAASPFPYRLWALMYAHTELTNSKIDLISYNRPHLFIPFMLITQNTFPVNTRLRISTIIPNAQPGAKPLLVFLPDTCWCSVLHHLAKHPLLPISLCITDHLDLLLSSPSSLVTFHAFSPRWSLPANVDYTVQESAASSASFAPTPTPRDLAISDWQSEYPAPHLLSHTFSHGPS